ncbi:MAG: pyruvate carboxylase [Firmicutes bacterium]|nr:pyruvate carboxylase [Bacillota bacterium]
MSEIKNFKRVLVANRGEIATRVIRACKELGIRSVAIYSEEDKNASFRTKADESYQIGKGKSPVDAYLSIQEIVDLAVAKGVDAIHPGYGLLSENPDFAQACANAGIEFIGPTAEMMHSLGDKIQSKIVAKSVDVKTIPGVEEAIKTEEEAIEFAEMAGYPVMLKAAAGGGGRGMRIVNTPERLVEEFNSAKSEALKAFGVDDIFIEKYLDKPKHIEVQIMGDKYGNIVHLYERDCSVQRRYQKVVEFTPSLCLTDEQREAICADAMKIAHAVDYRNAGTVEFLLDNEGNHYFIEMNPRIQVEHTVTELVTDVDLVQTQILVAQGYRLDSPEINLKQEDITVNGYAIQCRITTEDPLNGFAPDYGNIELYRSGSGFGIRLDAGNCYTGAEITPYYDSLLVKMTAHARTFEDTRRKAIRALRETIVKGVKTNQDFLINVLNHQIFKDGDCNTGFIGDHPELFNFAMQQDNEARILKFLGNKYVNETRGEKPEFNVPVFPKIPQEEINKLEGTKQILDKLGPKGLADWVLDQKRLLLTDTTMRDAQQSLMATRVRTVDMEKIAPGVAYNENGMFSLEMWGGATFDTSIRFLGEDPWERLTTLREKIPNILFQMLIRGANGVGYKNYPDNVIREFVKESAASGIDVFRIFDSLNWIQGMEVALDEVLNQGKVAEACICYTGDILDETRTKYTLDYYVRMAKELEKRGAHILGIKDMSGLLKPIAARELITALKNELTIPVHLHTHDTSGNGVATVLLAAIADVDICDAAISSMSGLTSQPSLNSIVAACEHGRRDTGLDLDKLQVISDYWADVRPVYKKFESDFMAATAEIYKYELPGGQYSNLKPQVESFGLGHKFKEVKDMYREVNIMLGDIVKVTPSSKAVGDMAIFMVQNELTPENIYEKAQGMDFPDSIVSFFEGMMGQPEGGFPEKLQKLVLKDREPITCRPGELLEPVDFEAVKKKLQDEYELEGNAKQCLSYALFEKVYEDYLKKLKSDGDFRKMGSDIFFHGLAVGETCEIKIEEGNEMVIKLLEVKDHNPDGTCDCIFELNGARMVVQIKDEKAGVVGAENIIVYADENDPSEVGANISGSIVKLLVSKGQAVEENEPIAVIEAMKMETNILATMSGVIDEICVKEGEAVDSGQLIARIGEGGADEE